MSIVVYFSPTLWSLLCFNESIEISCEWRGSLMVEVKSSGVKSIFWNVMSNDGPVPCSVEHFYRFVYFFLDGVLRMESHFVGLVLILQFRIQVGFVRCTGIHWQFCRWSHLFYPLLSCLFQHEARSCWISFGWLVLCGPSRRRLWHLRRNWISPGFVCLPFSNLRLSQWWSRHQLPLQCFLRVLAKSSFFLY